MEVWVNITESNNCMASNYGRLKRLSYCIYTTNGAGNIPHITTVPGKLLGGTRLSKKGYPRVTLRGKQYFIHSLIAKYFVPNPENKPQINHIDGIKTNNNSENLEWVINQENRNHAVRTGLHRGPERLLTSAQEVEIIILYRRGITQKEIAKRYNISQQAISKLIRRRTMAKILEIPKRDV